jgi:hypothetical protein
MTFGTRTFHVRRQGERAEQDHPSWRIFPRTQAARRRLRAAGVALPEAVHAAQRRRAQHDDD